MSLAAGTAALTLLPTCTVCTCKVPPVTPGTGPTPAAAAAAPAGGGLKGNVAYNFKNVVILGGGFVSGIIYSPVEKDLVFARTDVGGAYRWDPAGKSWVALTDQLGRDTNFLGIESLAADPVDANKVYLAAGEYTGSWVGNGAILKSTDRGNTWQTIDMPMKMGGNENGRSMGERLAIDPNLTSVLYFGSRKAGLWKSTDSATTWQKVAGFTASDGDKGIGIPVVVFDKSTGTKGKATPTIYAAVANNDGSLYRSTDAGATWKLVPGQPKGVMASHAEFDAAGELYLSYGNGPGPNDITTGSVWKLDPKKDKFTDITPVKPNGDDKFGYGGLSVDAKHPGTLVVSTLDRWSRHDDVFRTTDGGKKWKPLFDKAVRDDMGAKYLYWHKSDPIGRGWMGDIAIDPFHPERAMYVTGQGIWASEDLNAADGDKPTHWKFLDQGLEETVIKELVSPPVGPPLLSGMGDLCGFRHDDLGKPTAEGMFDNPLCGAATGLDVAWTKPDVVARVGWDDKKEWGGTSLDGGKTWTPFKSEPKGKGAGSIAVAADGSALVWAPMEGPVVVSHDLGATWARAEGLPDAESSPDWAPVPFRPAADRVNPKKFYVFDAKGGQAYASTDGGAHFTAAPTGLPGLGDYQYSSASVHATPGIEGDVWLTAFKELDHSTDSGKSYESIPSVSEAYALGFGKPAEGKTYPALYLIGKIGDVTGFFRSDDKGESWVRINDDLHQWGFCTVITGDPRVSGRVYIGTGGRGIIYGEPK
ncbi:MAG TPA: carbohydrate-binding protein [Polyangia bacterium]|nr:carbohydrate-binding protein [Polyangia bacterium]